MSFARHFFLRKPPAFSLFWHQGTEESKPDYCSRDVTHDGGTITGLKSSSNGDGSAWELFQEFW